MKRYGLVFGFCFLLFTLFAQKEITLQDIWQDYKFLPKSVSGFSSMPNSDFYSVKEKDAIVKHSFATGEKVEEILTEEQLSRASNGKLSLKNLGDYAFDASCTKILLSFDQEYIFRRSTAANHYVFDLKRHTLVSIVSAKKGKQSFAEFSADGTKVAFVRDYNLFYFDLNDKQEHQVTFDGKENNIRNGFADWVYEEELGLSKCFYWSPDGQKLAYLRFDESAVKEFAMTMWGDLYPETYKYKYPKAGEDNSVVEIYVYDVAKNVSQKLDFQQEDCYYPRLYWLNNSTDLIVLKLNRLQNQLDFYRYNTKTNQKEIVLTDKNDAWIEESDEYYFLSDNKTMIFTSERDGFNHIYKTELGKTPKQLTTGNFEIKQIVTIDEKEQLIYYLSNEVNVLNQDLYVMDFNGKAKKRLTDGTGWNRVTFNGNARFYCRNYSNANTPNVYTVYSADGKLLYTIEDNAVCKARLQEYGFAPKEFFSFETASGIVLNAWMLKPLDFDSTKKYPVLMYVYGGPGSQEVNNQFFRCNDFAWYQFLAQHGYLVVCVDGRGTAGRGDAFRKVIYKQMGKYEAIDQIESAQYLKTLPFVDESRVGIWGWSFGGYLSALSLFKGHGAFKMAMSVAPVTNWRYYDNVYTERFLQKPQDNPGGYDDNSPCFFAHDLDGAFLLVHGTGDDNVHFQNSMDLVTQLNKAGKQYDQFFYPNKNHFINGGNTRLHLYTKLTNFLFHNL